MIFDIILTMNLKSYIGDKFFYKQVASLAIPLSLQQLLGSAMEMIDSLMVSWIGMISAVGSASQIIIIASTITWGILSGTNIFASQFYGKKDHLYLKKVFGLSLCLTSINALFWISLISLFPEAVVRFYINDNEIIIHSIEYLNIARFTILLEAVSFTFSYHYRCVDKAALTLYVSIFSMLCNVVLNYIFIFGWGPIPSMNVSGAAFATLLSHFFSILIYLIYGIKTKQPFFGSFHEMFSFHFDFIRHVLRRVYPLIINEALFGFGSSLIIKALGGLSRESLEAYYIGDQIAAFFSFIIWGFGGSVQLMLSYDLGKGNQEQAIEKSRHFMGLALMLAIVLASLLAICSPFIMSFYNIQDEIIYASTKAILLVFCLKIAFRLFNFTIFSILRSGGDSRIISFLDAGIMYLIAIPLSFTSVYLFHIENVALVYLITQSEQVVRFILGIKRIHSGIWAKDLTNIE